MSKNKNSHEIDLSKYKDYNGLSLGKLNFGLWLSERRANITKLFIFFLVALSAFFFIYASYNYIIYYLNTPSEEDEKLVSKSVVSSPKNQVSDLIISNPYVFKHQESYDFAALIKNPNGKFSAYFEYCFELGEGEIFCANSFIFPNEEKFVKIIGQKSTSTALSASLAINNINWQRVDAHQIPDWGEFFNSRLNFSLENILLTPNNTAENNLSTLSFSITNRTPYSYYEMPLSINFYKDNELVGVNKYIVKDFITGDKRNIRLTWKGLLLGVTRTEIRPEINLLDESVYLKYQGLK